MSVAVVSVFLLSGCVDQAGQWIAVAPAGNEYTTIRRSGVTVLPNGRLLSPRGRILTVAPHPYGLVLSPDGTTAVTANSGVAPFSISIIRDIDTSEPTVQQVPEGTQTDEGVLASVFMGLAFSPDGGILYAGGGQDGSIIMFEAATGHRTGVVNLNGRQGDHTWEDSYIGDLVLSRDGRYLFAVDQSNFRVVIVDTNSARVVESVPVGRYPFGIALAPDQKHVYVANIGMYEYALLDGVDLDADPPRRGLSFPAFGHGTHEAREGTHISDYTVPGLGDPNAPEAFSVWGIDVTDIRRPKVTSRVKTGYLVGEKIEGFPTVGGSSPNSLVATDDLVFVSNGNNDTISVIDTRIDSVIFDIQLRLDPRLGPLRGAIPFGLALSPDGSRLYAAEAGINAVAVVDLTNYRVLGHIPTGWFPSKIAITPDSRFLVVANAKGFGSGPNGGTTFQVDDRGSYIGSLMNGFVSIIPIPNSTQLETDTRDVIANNFRFLPSESPVFASRKTNPVPLYPGQKPSPIRYLVFITKENRTYDEVFGQIADGVGEPALARYGMDVTFQNEDRSVTMEHADIMPNHLSLAAEFGIADNFYSDSDVSADGHRWLVGVYPNEWVETSVAASYGGKRSMIPGSTAPGMLAFVGSSAAIYPEDYNEAGSIWDHFDRHGIDFFNFGLGFEFAPGLEEQEYRYTGIRIPINYPMPGPLFEHTSRKFATYNTSIPDQFRVDMFIEEFEERWMGETKDLPAVLTMMLPNDHGAGERPDDGYPYRESYMADNDLALGRVIEYLSHTRYWKDMAIVVTEDDPQGGVDHVDAHRSILMVISPWVKRSYVSSVHYSFGSIMKTFWNILGVPYLNQYDAGATDLSDFFQETPDLAPFTAVAPDPRVFDPQKALDPLDAEFNWDALADSPELDNVDIMKSWSRVFDSSNDESANLKKE